MAQHGRQTAERGAAAPARDRLRDRQWYAALAFLAGVLTFVGTCAWLVLPDATAAPVLVVAYLVALLPPTVWTASRLRGSRRHVAGHVALVAVEVALLLGTLLLAPRADDPFGAALLLGGLSFLLAAGGGLLLKSLAQR
ncbi:hypothetical protein DT076_14080 [Desertihabitans brevis]|uniref:Uncharacterized protein n=1 Tax=Desertihabitans brevis TaxID=2268447 RepID=A0A367YS99_9ACTN|nr:hypothetical protein [Desertihabitans brevis]RCK68714.1 hypothetical protein DT076_14080 [Desertihabitans brevis]